MEKYDSPLKIMFWGDYACFTRPENKVERVSYLVPTPSAVKGMLESIFWKPEFKWIVQKIHVLNPIKKMSILRNELSKKCNPSEAMKWSESGKGQFLAGTDKTRTQRNSIILRDVAYIIEANVKLNAGAGGNEAKYRNMFRRRVSKGQCFTRPYLGNREFSAFFSPVDEEYPPRTLPLTIDLGRMLYSVNYASLENDSDESRFTFFDAQLENGVMNIPDSGDFHAIKKVG